MWRCKVVWLGAPGEHDDQDTDALSRSSTPDPIANGGRRPADVYEDTNNFSFLGQIRACIGGRFDDQKLSTMVLQADESLMLAFHTITERNPRPHFDTFILQDRRRGEMQKGFEDVKKAFSELARKYRPQKMLWPKMKGIMHQALVVCKQRRIMAFIIDDDGNATPANKRVDDSVFRCIDILKRWVDGNCVGNVVFPAFP